MLVPLRHIRKYNLIARHQAFQDLTEQVEAAVATLANGASAG